MTIVHIKNSNFWYQEFQLLISANEFLISIMYYWYQYLNSWYQQIIVDISYAIADIKNSNYWYQQWGINVNSPCHSKLNINVFAWYSAICTSSSYACDLVVTSIKVQRNSMKCSAVYFVLSDVSRKLHSVYHGVSVNSLFQTTNVRDVESIQ